MAEENNNSNSNQQAEAAAAPKSVQVQVQEESKQVYQSIVSASNEPAAAASTNKGYSQRKQAASSIDVNQ
jgi:hypothetical protein